VAQARGEQSSPAMRHQVINTAAGLLSDAGLLDDAEQLLQDELGRSQVPFYFMHNLAAIAKKRGDPAGAVLWYERAWERATGAATRLQWGATYLQALIDFAPADAARIERIAGQLRDEVASVGDAGCQRNRTQLERIGSKLSQWNGIGPQAMALRDMARAASQD
jgi:hypothetical protein